MDLVNDLGNDVAMAVLIEKKHKEKIDKREIIGLISRLREVLEPVSAKDHSTSVNVSEDTLAPLGFPAVAGESAGAH